MGAGIDSQGDYWHNGGSLSTDETWIGEFGTGTFDHRSGVHTTNHLILGSNGGGEGTYSMAVSPSGGPAPELNASQVTLGDGPASTGTFTMSTGEVNVTGNVHIGAAAGATGSLTVDRPSAVFQVGGDVIVGGDGEGTLRAKASGVLGFDGGMTIGGAAAGEVVLEGGQIHGPGVINITAGTGTLRGLGYVKALVFNEGVISAEGSMLRFWEPVHGAGAVNVVGSASVEFEKSSSIEGPIDCPSGSVRILGGTFYLRGGMTGNGHLSSNGVLNVRSDVNARSVSVGQWGSTTAVLDHGNSRTVTVSETYIGSIGRYDLHVSAVLDGGDTYVGGLFDHQAGQATFGDLEIGGGDEYDWMPGHVAEYRLTSGRVEAENLIIGVPGPYNPFDPMPGRLTVLEADAEVVVTGGVTLGPVSELDLPPGMTINMTGSFWENSSEDPAALADLMNLELIFEGGTGVVDPFEVAGVDLGATMDGYIENFALGTLRIGSTDVGDVLLMDESINCDGVDEALYVEHLIIGAGSRLDLGGQRLFYKTAAINPAATVLLSGGEMTQVPEPATLALLMFGAAALFRRASRKPHTFREVTVHFTK